MTKLSQLKYGKLFSKDINKDLKTTEFAHDKTWFVIRLQLDKPAALVKLSVNAITQIEEPVVATNGVIAAPIKAQLSEGDVLIYELRNGPVSNRFAAGLVKNSQFASITKPRDIQANTGYSATKVLRNRQLKIEEL